MKKVIFFAGGTLGHIYPAISLIKELNKLNVKTYLCLTFKDRKYKLEEKLLNTELIYMDAYGFNRKKLISSLYKNIIAYYKIKQKIKKINPNLCIGMGGYISGIGIYASLKLKIKTIIHEQNSIIGFANKMVYKHVNRFLVSFPSSYKHSILIGNPRYDEANEYFLKNQNLNDHNKNNILFISGSLGSKSMNDLAIQFIKKNYCHYQITVITGHKYYEEVKKEIDFNIYKNVYIIPFTDNMFNHILKNNIIVSRAGSTTLFEILGMNKVSIIIPSPNVTNNHQEHNSRIITNNLLGEVILEKDLNINNFINTLNKIKLNYDMYQNNLVNLNLPNSKIEFMKNIKELLGE